MNSLFSIASASGFPPLAFLFFSASSSISNGRGSELAQLFGTSFFESGTIPKPKPDVYLYAMHQLNATPQQCIAVEDSIPGASAAISAGIKTFGYTRFSSNPQNTEKALKALGVQECFNHWPHFINLI
nr:HAD family phosphatase [Holospora curviuscula]